MVCSVVRTSACRVLFVRYSLSSLPACLTSTFFTSCSSTAPLSGLANLLTMKSSGAISFFLMRKSFYFCFHMETLVYSDRHAVSQFNRSAVRLQGEGQGS